MTGLPLVFKYFILLIVLFTGHRATLAEDTQESLKISTIYHFSVSGSINPAVFHYLEVGFQQIESEKKPDETPAILIQLNTPGGLVSTTKDILTLFGKYPWPIIIWVGPEAASATSAGAFISASSHILLMAPGSNIGAATPITMQGDLPNQDNPPPIPGSKQKKSEKQKAAEKKKQSDVRAKAINDLTALVRSLSQARGRNGSSFEEMISKASSFTAQEAIEKNIAEKIVPSLREIPAAVNGMSVKIHGKKKTLDTSHSVTKTKKMNLGDKLLNILSHPQTAYLLFLLGAALLYFEFQAPGGFIAGSLGVLCLLFAAFAFQILPLNMVALLLIIASFAFFVLEIYITSYGMLSLVGLCALIFGSLFLFDTDDSLLAFHWKYVASTVAGVVLTMGLLGWYFWKTRLKSETKDFFYPLDQTGRVTREKVDGHYMIKVSGERWKAESDDLFNVGDEVIVTGSVPNKLIVHIKKKT
jgi:membrane-bound serine protease (ClpP class)